MRLDAIDEAILQRALAVQLLVLDVDGVLTDGKIFMSNQGDEIKAFCTQDGQGIKNLQATGVQVAIITARQSDIVVRRARELGISDISQNCKDKGKALKELTERLRLTLSSVAYMGDDYADLPALYQAGLATSPNNGHWRVQEHCHWISDRCGGDGAVRQLCDLVMMAQGTFEPAVPIKT